MVAQAVRHAWLTGRDVGHGGFAARDALVLLRLAVGARRGILGWRLRRFHAAASHHDRQQPPYADSFETMHGSMDSTARVGVKR